jgi:hypothetical protein
MRTGKRLSRKRKRKRKLKMSEVKILRLTTGEEVLCKAEKTDGGWKVKKSALIIPTGKGGIGLLPWMPYTTAFENGFEIREQDVMFEVQPQDELIDEYNDVFGSGLIVPKKADVIDGSSLKLTT